MKHIQHTDLSEYERKSIEKFGQSVLDGKWSNDGLVSLLKVIAEDFLQAKRISVYAEQYRLSTQWVRQKQEVFTIDNFQFIPDND